MIPQNRDDLHVLAGEYVLGVLDEPDASEVAAALATNTDLRRAVTFWEEQLHPLSELASPALPPGRHLGGDRGTDRQVRAAAGRAALLGKCRAVALVDRGLCRRRRGARPLDFADAGTRAQPCRGSPPAAAGSAELDRNRRSLRCGGACGYRRHTTQ
jgi:anti-sigma factor RsiW